jgi:putative ABC transport system permease protein
MAVVWQECRWAVRFLRRAPAFTTLAILVIAAGIGAATAIFSLVDAALTRPLPFADPDRLVMLWEHAPSYARNRVSPLNFADWLEQNRTFGSMAAVAGFSRVLTRDGATAERIAGQSVTSAFFDVLGIRPLAGRTFVAADSVPNSNVVIVGERFWRTHLDSDPRAIGRTLTLDGIATTVIGVVPSTFQFLFPADIWSPFPLRRTPEQRRQHYLAVVGRLAPGRTIDDARADIAVVANNIAQIAPDTNKNWTVTIEPLRDGLVGAELRSTAFVFGGVVLFVLLMACGNVANLLLARGVGRARELAVRGAIGASAAQVIRLLLVESLILAAGGGALGIGLAWAAVRAAPSLLPVDLLPTGITMQFDVRVALAALLLSMVTGVLFGVAPARYASRVSLVEALAAGTRTTASAGRLRRTLAVVQVAGAVLLLSAAGLMIRTLVAMRTGDVGFHADSVVTMFVTLPFNQYRDEESIRVFDRRVQTSLAALPGVRRVALGNNLPLDGWDIGQPVAIVGDPPVDASSLHAAHYVMVSPEYFETLGIKITSGRAFDPHDVATSEPVCIVNPEFVRRFLSGRDPLRAAVQVLPMAFGPNPSTPARRIVGVVAQVAIAAGEVEKAATIYVPVEQNAWYTTAIAIRTDGDPMRSVDAVRHAIATIDSAQPVTRVRTLEEIAAEAVVRPAFRARLVGTFAGVATTLAGIGIFGVLMFSVRERTREFGVRRALGATPVHIVRDVAVSGARIAAIGTLAGVAAAAALTRLLSSLLFGVAPLDPVTFVAAPALLATVAIAACVVPALVAVRADPAVALRQE